MLILKSRGMILSIFREPQSTRRITSMTQTIKPSTELKISVRFKKRSKKQKHMKKSPSAGLFCFKKAKCLFAFPRVFAPLFSAPSFLRERRASF